MSSYFSVIEEKNLLLQRSNNRMYMHSINFETLILKLQLKTLIYLLEKSNCNIWWNYM